MSSDYRQRFNKIYRHTYDIPSWSCYPISQDIIDFTNLLVSNHQINRDSNILDAGCGRGRLIIKLKKHGFTNIVGIDVSDEAVKCAIKATDNPTILRADIIKGLPFPDDSFNLILDITTTSSCHPHHWPIIWKEYHRLLKDNSYFISEMFFRPPSTPPTQSLKKTSQLIPNGLDRIYGITQNEIKSTIKQFFSIIQIVESFPDSLGRMYFLAKKTTRLPSVKEHH